MTFRSEFLKRKHIVERTFLISVNYSLFIQGLNYELSITDFNED